MGLPAPCHGAAPGRARYLHYTIAIAMAAFPTLRETHPNQADVRMRVVLPTPLRPGTPTISPQWAETNTDQAGTMWVAADGRAVGPVPRTDRGAPWAHPTAPTTRRYSRYVGCPHAHAAA